MNEMLRTILDMDKEARKKLEEAENYRREAVAGLSAKKAAVVEDETRKAKESAQRRSATRKSEGEKNLAEIKERNRKITDNLNSLYEKNADRWVEEIVNNVTKI